MKIARYLLRRIPGMIVFHHPLYQHLNRPEQLLTHLTLGRRIYCMISSTHVDRHLQYTGHPRTLQSTAPKRCRPSRVLEHTRNRETRTKNMTFRWLLPIGILDPPGSQVALIPPGVMGPLGANLRTLRLLVHCNYPLSLLVHLPFLSVLHRSLR